VPALIPRVFNPWKGASTQLSGTALKGPTNEDTIIGGPLWGADLLPVRRFHGLKSRVQRDYCWCALSGQVCSHAPRMLPAYLGFAVFEVCIALIWNMCPVSSGPRCG
jgi:hypothetical protein